MRVTSFHKGRETLREFRETDILIGRGRSLPQPGLDLLPDETVSRIQARLWVQDQRCWIEDLNSRFGTYVNGIKLEYPRQLNPADIVTVGETDLRVEVPAATTPAVAPPPPPVVEDVVEKAVEPDQESFRRVAGGGGQSQDRLALLLELPLLFGSLHRMENLMQFVIQRIIPIIPGAERGLVVQSHNGQLRVMAHHPMSEVPFSETLVRRALRERRGFIWRKSHDGIPSHSVRDLRIKTGMYAPMIWEGRVYGVLCVDNPRREGVFGEDDLRLLLVVGQYAGMALAQHMDKTPAATGRL